MKLKPKQNKYLNKWEWGLVEGFFNGIAFLVVLSDLTYTAPATILMLVLQIFIVVLIIFDLGRGKTPKIKSKAFQELTKRVPFEPQREKPSTSRLLLCPSCGAKAVVRKGKAWIPRHKRGCPEA